MCKICMVGLLARRVRVKGSMSSETDVDGSTLEGGGQILRMTMAFSALLGGPVRVQNIRARRSQPGLQGQHLKGLELVRDICGGQLRGGEIGSTEITFYPGKIRDGKYVGEILAAGSVSLLVQVALPCALFASGPTYLTLRGVTNSDMAPHIDNTLEVFKPVMKRFGVEFDLQIIRRGYFPRGGGEIQLQINPVKELAPVTMLDPGQVSKVYGWCYVAGVVPIKVAHAMAEAADTELRKQFPCLQVYIQCYKEKPQEAIGNGSGINLVAETTTGCLLGGNGLGKCDVPPEETGRTAALEVLECLSEGVCVDKYMQDQLIIYMALANGKSRVKCGTCTLHTQAAIHVAHVMTGAKFNASDDGILECDGIGLSQ